MLTREERFWSKVDKSGECWVWTRALDRYGYGQFYWHKGRYQAHRIAWELEHGVVPRLCILHRCDNPKCVRASHLFEGTRIDNALDMISKGRDRFGGYNKFKTHCKHGHEFTIDNIYRQPSRPHRRMCKTCNRLNIKAYHLAKYYEAHT